MLTMGNAMRGVFPITYYASCGVYFSATNASAPIKVVQPITTNYTRYDTGVMPSNDWNDNINDIGSSAFTGSSGNNVVISGGWNRTDMSTQGTGSAGIGGLLSNVALTVTAGQEENVVKAIVHEINKGPHSDGLIVIADDANSVFCHTGITACGTITHDVNPAT